MRLQAKVELAYAGQVWQPGALFDALPQDGREFINRDQAVPYNLEDPSTRSVTDIVEEMRPPEPPPPPAPVTVWPASTQLTAAGGAGNFSVYMSAEGSWTPTATETWLHIDSPTGLQTANGTVNFTAQANNGTVGQSAANRTGTIQVNDAVFAVTQAPWDVLPVEVSPKDTSLAATSSVGNTFEVTITGSGTSGTWTVDTENAARTWLIVTSPTVPQSMDGPVTFSVQANTGTERTGKFFVNGQPFTVTQAGV